MTHIANDDAVSSSHRVVAPAPAAAAAAGPSPTDLFRSSLKMPALIPPLRFCLLATSFRDLSDTRRVFDPALREPQAPDQALPRIYSSSHPLPRHLPFLSRLQLKTIVALTPKDPFKQVSAMQDWTQSQGIRLKWIKVGTWKDVGTNAITRDAAQEAVSALVSSNVQPVLLITLTPQPASMILALLRLLQGQPLTSIHSELHRSLRAGLEGDADEDDREDCEKWIQGWVGKECQLAAPRSNIAEWLWPREIQLGALRHQVDVPHRPSSQPHVRQTSTSVEVSVRATQQSSKQQRIGHPHLKVTFQPEPVAAAVGAGDVQDAGTQSSSGAGSSATVLPPSVSAPAAIRRTRKRSNTISEGRGDDALSSIMSDSAATAAIQSCGIDIGTGSASAMLSLPNASDDALTMSKSVPGYSSGSTGPTTPTTSVGSSRRPALAPAGQRYPQQVPVQPHGIEIDAVDNIADDDDDDDDDGDQSTPKAQTRPSYIAASGGGFGEATQQVIADEDFLPSTILDDAGGDETPTKARYGHARTLGLQRRGSLLSIGQDEGRSVADGKDDEDDDDGSRTAKRDHFVGWDRDGAARADQARGSEASSSAGAPGSEEGSTAQSHSEVGTISDAENEDVEEEEEDEEEEDEEDEEEEERDHSEEDDFSARLEALDLA